jgi:hypothetical protein
LSHIAYKIYDFPILKEMQKIKKKEAKPKKTIRPDRGGASQPGERGSDEGAVWVIDN